VFAVREREALIKPEWREDLFRYIAGVLKNNKVKLLAIGGVDDHIHILFGMNPNIALSDLVRDVKANSSKFINEKRFVRGKFYWQEGFGAFSYSRSQIDTVAKYVLNQEKQHAKRTFRDEYIEMLDRFGVDYDERYLFDWIV
jgi:REP element-mobilizing transposase RayT